MLHVVQLLRRAALVAMHRVTGATLCVDVSNWEHCTGERGDGMASEPKDLARLDPGTWPSPALCTAR